MRVFSFKRIGISVALGFLLPVIYAFTLFFASEYTGKATPDLMMIPIKWPVPLWDYLMGPVSQEDEPIPGLLFVTACNTTLYTPIIYAALTILPVFKRKQASYEPPPPPEQQHR